MKDVEQTTGTLHIRARMPNSRNGNPRFVVQVGDVVGCTTPDSALAYDVQNLEGKEVRAGFGWHYGRIQADTIEEV